MFGRLFNWNKTKAPSWSQLTGSQKESIRRKIQAMAGPRYKIVSGFDQTQRERGMVESQNEDHILDAHSRGRLLDLTRNATRNSATFATILKQFDFNVCGTKAGKVIISFDDKDLAHELRDKFAAWTRQADFFDGLSFNQLLKIVMKNALIGGDCVLLFDDGMVEDSARMIVYESDEIGNTTPEALAQHYGKKATQSLGKVYNRNSRWIGTVVSRACRGQDVFDPDKSYFLRRDPNGSLFDSIWMQPSNVWRVAQGRGISQATSSIGTILDLEDLCGYELQAAKKNSQMFAQIVRSNPASVEEQMPTTFDESTDIDGMTDEQLEQAVKEESSSYEQVVSFNKAMSCGIVYEQMPEDYKMELLSTNHPNDNIQEFVKWLAGRSSAVYGLSEAYATLMPTGADFRAQQILTQPAFLEAQKFLEQICDWTLYRFVRWMDRHGEFDASRLPHDWMRQISWSWPTIDEVDEVAHQNAVEMKLRNLTGTLKEELGSDWQEKLMQVKREMDFCKANNIPHVAYSMISGGERTGADTQDEPV